MIMPIKLSVTPLIFIPILCWVYQQKLYRYMLARWGYSRSLGIWELVNEIDALTAGRVVIKPERSNRFRKSRLSEGK